MIELCCENLSVRCIWLCILVMSRTSFTVNPHSIVVWTSRNSLLETGAKSERELTATGLESRTTYFLNEHSTIWPNWPDDWAVFRVLICSVHLTVCSCHIRYAFQSESTFYSWLNVKEHLAGSRCEIWRWSNCKWKRTQNHSVLKWALNRMAKLAKWWSCVLSTYLHCAFDGIFSSCHVRVSEWIHTL